MSLVSHLNPSVPQEASSSLFPTAFRLESEFCEETQPGRIALLMHVSLNLPFPIAPSESSTSDKGGQVSEHATMLCVPCKQEAMQRKEIQVSVPTAKHFSPLQDRRGPIEEEDPNHQRSFGRSTWCEPSREAWIQAPFTLPLLKLHLSLPQPTTGAASSGWTTTTVLGLSELPAGERKPGGSTARPRLQMHFPAQVKHFTK